MKETVVLKYIWTDSLIHGFQRNSLFLRGSFTSQLFLAIIQFLFVTEDRHWIHQVPSFDPAIRGGFIGKPGGPATPYLANRTNEIEDLDGTIARRGHSVYRKSIQIAYYSSCHANKKLSPRRAQSLPRSLFGLIRLDTRHLIAKVNA